MRIIRRQVIVALAVASAVSCYGQTALTDFGTLSLDQLTNIEITSFTNRGQMLSQVAGAVYVTTQEQIEGIGLNSVPEPLRLAPDIDVAPINGNQWSVSARGPMGAFANRLLVLIDPFTSKASGDFE